MAGRDKQRRDSQGKPFQPTETLSPAHRPAQSERQRDKIPQDKKYSVRNRSATVPRYVADQHFDFGKFMPPYTEGSGRETIHIAVGDKFVFQNLPAIGFETAAAIVHRDAG